MAPWHHTPAARAILSRLAPEDIHVARYRPLTGPDSLVLTCAGKDRLAAIRTACVERAFGATFNEAYGQGRAEDWFGANDAEPSVDEVLFDLFGDPNLYGRDPVGAEAHVRAGMAQNIGKAA